MTDARTVAPVLFFGTDEYRNEGVKDFRPTPTSFYRHAVKQEETAAEAVAKSEEVESGDPKDSASAEQVQMTPEEVTREIHPSNLETENSETKAIHPDLDF